MITKKPTIWVAITVPIWLFFALKSTPSLAIPQGKLLPLPVLSGVLGYGHLVHLCSWEHSFKQSRQLLPESCERKGLIDMYFPFFTFVIRKYTCPHFKCYQFGPIKFLLLLEVGKLSVKGQMTNISDFSGHAVLQLFNAAVTAAQAMCEWTIEAVF